MATRRLELRDVSERRSSRLRLLAPLRYLAIRHPEKTTYDLIAPLGATAAVCVIYFFIHPKPAIFGEVGLLKFARDLLIMAVPFMIGALATVAMASPGSRLDSRPMGADLFLDGELLTLRQFVCYLLGYLSFLGLVTLFAAVAATLFQPTVSFALAGHSHIASAVKGAGVVLLSSLLSSLSVTVLWSLYFLTDIVNRK